MITFRLFDSLPNEVLAKLKAQSKSTTDPDYLNSIEEYLDNGNGECNLRLPEIADAMQATLLRSDNEKYILLAWVIMPNHVHVVASQCEGWPLAKIVHGWKSFTAHRANKFLGRKGRFWQPDYFDRMIRDDDHLHSAIEYIHNNPVKAGLVSRADSWEYSSYRRLVFGETK